MKTMFNPLDYARDRFSYERTRNQMSNVIIIDCMRQVNALELTDEHEADFNLKAMLRERLYNEDRQMELKYLS